MYPSFTTSFFALLLFVAHSLLPSFAREFFWVLGSRTQLYLGRCLLRNSKSFESFYKPCDVSIGRGYFFTHTGLFIISDDDDDCSSCTHDDDDCSSCTHDDDEYSSCSHDDDEYSSCPHDDDEDFSCTHADDEDSSCTHADDEDSSCTHADDEDSSCTHADDEDSSCTHADDEDLSGIGTGCNTQQTKLFSQNSSRTTLLQ